MARSTSWRPARPADERHMKVLTLVTVILLPSTVLAGIMRMNFRVGLFDLVWDVLGRDCRDARHGCLRAIGRTYSTFDLAEGLVAAAPRRLAGGHEIAGTGQEAFLNAPTGNRKSYGRLRSLRKRLRQVLRSDRRVGN